MKSVIKTTSEARKAYYRKWRAEHKDKIKEYNRRYWEKKDAALEIAANANNDDERKD